MNRRWFAATLVAAMMLIAAPGVLAAAQTRIGINGGRPTEWPILSDVLAGQGLTQAEWLEFATRVGENWLPNTPSVPLNYPGQLGLVSGPSALTADQSTAVGQALLHELILSELKKGPVAVAGLSQGTLVIEKELAFLATLSEDDAPSRDALTFFVFGDMLRGLGQMYLSGVTIPFIGQTFGPVPETQYDTVVVNEQWDGWANPPDRPWNVLAVFNAVMGAVYTVNGSNDHSQTSLDSLADAVKMSEVTNELGGTTTTYLIPREELPLTRPLRQLGVPGSVVDEMDKLLMPLIRAGYSSLTPNLGPRIERGQLVWTAPPAPVIEPTSTAAQDDPTTVATTMTHTDKTPDAVETPDPQAAIATNRAATVAAVSVGDEERQQLSDAGEVGSLTKDEPEPEVAVLPSSADVDEPVDAVGSAATVDTDGSINEVPRDDTERGTRPVRVRESADLDSAVDDHQVKPSVASDTGTARTDAPPNAAASASTGG